MKIKAILVAGALAAGTITALAHGGATGIVKERMDAMSIMAGAMKSLGSIVRGSAEFDKNVVREAAKSISAHAGENLTKLFPENVQQDASEAKGDIWENWDEFVSMAQRLERLADGLELAAEVGLDGKNNDINLNNEELPSAEKLAEVPFKKLFMQIGKSCGSCHEKYRAKKQ